MKRTIRLLSLATIGAAALVALSPAAHAQATAGTVIFNNDLSGLPSFSTSFSSIAPLVNPFSQTLTFTTATAGSVTIGVQTSATGDSNDVDFTNVFLTGTGIVGSVPIMPISGDPLESLGLANFALGIGTFVLTLEGTPGTQTGSFGGSVAFQAQSAVPEPGTWAMMLIGFGAVGFSMRRKRPSMLQAA